jgi:hypothetical protein
MQSCLLAQPDPVIRDRPLEGSSLIDTDVWVWDTLDPPVMETTPAKLSTAHQVG